MTEKPAAGAATGWKEMFMGGSPEAEQRLFSEVLPKIPAIQRTVSAQDAATIRRAFHNKGDPLKLRFEVSNELPPALQVGFLRPGARYEGFGRFSRAQSHNRKDSSFDGRGLAFRLVTDDGPQDVLLSNTPVSFAPDPVTFVKAGKIFANHNMFVAVVKLPFALGPCRAVKVAANLAATTPDDRISLTSQRYWSRVPFRLGAVALKLVAVPVPPGEVRCSGEDPDFLTEQLRDDLRQGDRIFTLHVQLFVDEGRTPIEDASKEWKEADSPLVLIGTVTIPRQDLDDEASRAWPRPSNGKRR